jgi:hypothetical protein
VGGPQIRQEVPLWLRVDNLSTLECNFVAFRYNFGSTMGNFIATVGNIAATLGANRSETRQLHISGRQHRNDTTQLFKTNHGQPRLITAQPWSNPTRPRARHSKLETAVGYARYCIPEIDHFKTTVGNFMFFRNYNIIMTNYYCCAMLGSKN